MNAPRLLFVTGLVLLAVLTSGRFVTTSTAADAGETADSPKASNAASSAASAGATMDVLDVSRSWRSFDDPRADGWETEALAEQVHERLLRIGRFTTSAEPVSVTALEPIVTTDFTCGSLVPERLETTFADRSVTVSSAAIDEGSVARERPGSHLGAAGLAEALETLAATLPDGDATASFKVVSIEVSDDSIVTRQLVEIVARSSDTVVEQHATWLARWKRAADQGPPRLQWLAVGSFEQARTAGAAAPLFSDVTASVLGDNESYGRQLRRGYAHWVERITDWPPYENLATPGIAVGDVNGDGLDDIYLGQQAGLPNKLFVQRRDGSAVDVSRSAGVDWLMDTRGVLLVDLDDDGDQDLVAATLGNVVLAANDGSGSFEVRAVVGTGTDTMSVSAADHDGDGDLDLYVCAYFPDPAANDPHRSAAPGAAAGYVYHDANNGGTNALLRNDGGWQFTDVTVEAGLDLGNRRWSFAAAWEDYDNDGDQDLYVANDYGRNNLYRNHGGRFRDVAREAGVEDSASGMSVAWGDHDRDGWMDVYVSNMFSAAGSRITGQREFKTDAPEEVRARIRRFARGNTLLRNRGGGGFDDVSVEAGVTHGRWAWGSSFVDVNGDGWDDLAVANGYITSEDSGDL